ncbi:hypothetical protein VCHENC02_5750B, partial [Vibrio harveyi]
LTNNSRL